MLLEALAISTIIGSCNLNNTGYLPCTMGYQIQDDKVVVGFQLATGDILTLGGYLESNKRFSISVSGIQGVWANPTGYCDLLTETLDCRIVLEGQTYSMKFRSNTP